MNFEDLNLIQPLLKAVKEKGYTSATPIQEKSIPPILEGRDLIGCAQTGTGKTASFAIPILQRLSQNKQTEFRNDKIKALIITPTRELAIQIDESFAEYGKHTRLRHAVIFGGVKAFHQIRELKKGVDILTATPGRLLDLMNQGVVRLDKLQIFTLDEADRMLDMGFIHDIKKIIKKLPDKRQSLFFSATMPPVITTLAETLLKNPIRVEVSVVSSTADTVTQKLYHVDKTNKKPLLTHLLKDKKISSALVFTRTKHGANKITEYINKAGITALAIHGNKSQAARQKALASFKNNETRILVATDIAARGIDIDELAYVINFEIPNEPENYVHRIGRTGRAKRSGTAISFADHEEQYYIEEIHEVIKREIPIVKDHPFPRMIKPTLDSRTGKPIKPKGPGKGGGGGSRNGGGRPRVGKRPSNNNDRSNTSGNSTSGRPPQRRKNYSGKK